MAKLLFNILTGTRTALFFALVLVPPLFFGGTGKSGVFLIQSLVLLSALLFALQAAFFDLRPFGAELKHTYIFTAVFMLFPAYVALQIAGGHAVFSHLPGSVASFRSVDYLAQLFCYIIFFFLCLDFFSSRKKVNRLTVCVALELVFMIALGYYQEFSQLQKFGKMYGIFDMTKYDIYFSTFLNPNHYGAFVMIAGLFLAARIFYYIFALEYFKVNAVFVQALLCGIVLILGLFSVYHAHARAALAAALLSLATLAAMASPPNRRWHVFAAIGVVAACVGLYIAFSKMNLSEFAAAILMSDMGGRMTIYRESLGAIKGFGPFGSGLGTTLFVSPLYQSASAENYNWLHIYNHHLELLEETGVLGYLFFIGPLAALCVVSLRKALKSGSNWNKIYGAASFSAILFIGLFSFVDDYLLTPAVALFFIMYLAVLVKSGTQTFLRLPAKSHRAADWAPSGRRALSYGGLTVACLSLFYFLASDYQAARVYNYADGNIDRLKLATRLKAEDPDNWIALGDAYYDHSLTQDQDEFVTTAKASIRAYEEACKLVPISFKAWTALGRAKILMGDRTGGFNDIERGLTLSPFNRDAYLYAIAHYLRIAEETPWRDEKELFQSKAEHLIGKTHEIKKPLLPNDFRYLMNWHPDPLSPEDNQRVSKAIGEYLKHATHTRNS